MTEENLKYLSLEGLFSLMVKTIEEYLILHKYPSTSSEAETKRSELVTIQKVIKEKQAEKLHHNRSHTHKL